MDVKITDFMKTKRIDNRVGIVEFSHCWLTESDLNRRKKLYQVIVPLSSIYDNSRYQSPIERMVCYSDLFEEVTVGEVIPTYSYI